MHINQALYTIYSSNTTNQTIRCNQNEDCSIICTDCGKKVIYCQPGYSCSIDCQQCDNSDIFAMEVTNINMTCTHCDYANIISTLSQLDSQFQLDCTGSIRSCIGMAATIDHMENIYHLTSMSSNIDYTVNINCNGTSACQNIYIDSTINGHFSAICDGFQTCGYGTMIYNPPSQNNGQLYVQCLAGFGEKQSCMYTHIMSLSARQMYIECGDGTQTNDQLVCSQTLITGPVMPYDDTINSYHLSNINEDSVVVDCNWDQCSMDVFVPFGEFQVTTYNFYGWGVNHYCGWDFPTTGWNFPERRLDCDDKKEVKGIVVDLLNQGANIIVTNKFTDSYVCEDGNHCILYGMDRGTPQTNITCPKDTVSFCYVLAMQADGLNNSIIDGSAVQHLLLTGYDEHMLRADRAFSGATIYAPNGTIVPDGILSIAAGNAVNSFENVIIYAKDTPFIMIPQTFSGFVGATMYLNHNGWVHIECDYHDMCQHMQIYIDNPDFSIQSNDILPDNGNNLCITCDPDPKREGCKGMTVWISDAGNKLYPLNATQNGDAGWYWSNDLYRWSFPIPETSGSCSSETQTIMDNTWYWWYDEYSDAPQTCNWFFSWGYTPPIDDFCWMGGRGDAWKQYCQNGIPIFESYSQQALTRRLMPGFFTNCSGEPNMNAETMPADCSIINSMDTSCEYATYRFRQYSMGRVVNKENIGDIKGDIGFGDVNMTATCNESYISNVLQQAVFVEQCVVDGRTPARYYICNRWNNTLTLIEYNNSDNCTGEYIYIEYTMGDCMIDNDNRYEIFVEDISCYGYPTPQPTLPPTPICLSLTVNVTDANHIFNKDDFNGLYTYNSIESQFDAPIWEMPYDPHGQNLRYYDGNWIIHGKGYNVLMHKVLDPQISYAYAFPPYEDLEAEWSYSKYNHINNTFHIWIRCIDSFAPTFSPTVSPNNNDNLVLNTDPTSSPTTAPTRDPTASGNIYDGSIGIVYVFTNLTTQNYDFILNDNNGIDYVKELIEKYYFHSKYLPSYQYFMITILKLNGVPVNEATKAIILYNNKNILYVKALIEFKSEYEYYLLTISKNPKWETNVTKGFIEYFNNTKMEFYVANSSTLHSSIEEEIISPSFGATFGTLNAMLIICICISVLAYLYNKYSYQWICEKHKLSRISLCGLEGELTPVDSSDWLAPTFYGLAIYDIISDINLTSEIWTAMGVGAAHIPGEDSEGEIDSTKEYLLIIAAWGMLLCILIPYCMNVYFAARIPRKTASNMHCRTYFSPSGNLSLFITLVVFSGACYPSLDLVGSGIFGLSIANCGLTSFELNQLSEKRVLAIVLSYNIPSILMQIFYAYSIGLISPNTTLAFCTSFASVVGSLLTYIIHKDKKGIVHNVDYYLEVKHFDESDLSDNERKYIDTIKGMKEELSQDIVNTYEVIPIENFEISFVTIRRDDFVIRIVQHLHEQDLAFNIKKKTKKKNDDDDDDAYSDDGINKMRSYSMEIEDEYDAYCRNLYMTYKADIDRKVFEFYCQLEKEIFSIEYHSVFPGSLDNIQTDIDLYGNHETVGDGYGNIQGIMQHAMGGGYNNTNVSSNTYIYNTNGEIMEPQQQQQPEVMSSHYEFWHDRRDQFSKGYEIIKNELEKLKNENGPNFIVNSMQIHRFIRILNDNNINPTVIEDIINFSIKSKTFNRQTRRDSDIDISKTNDTHYLMDQEIEMWATQNN